MDIQDTNIFTEKELVDFARGILSDPPQNIKDLQTRVSRILEDQLPMTIEKAEIKGREVSSRGGCIFVQYNLMTVGGRNLGWHSERDVYREKGDLVRRYYDFFYDHLADISD